MMIKVAIFLIVMCPSICFAEVSGYLFLGKYLNHEQQDLEGRDIAYRAGIYLELKTKGPIFFMQDETLIRDIDGGRSFPKQINYMIGVKQQIGFLEVMMRHECLHPVDGTSGGKKATSYNLIEGRLNF